MRCRTSLVFILLFFTSVLCVTEKRSEAPKDSKQEQRESEQGGSNQQQKQSVEQGQAISVQEQEERKMSKDGRSVKQVISETMTSQLLAKLMPRLFDLLPDVLVSMITMAMEFVVERGKSLLDWVSPKMNDYELDRESLNESIIGRFIYWDALDTALKLMKVGKECRAKVACEFGAYLLHGNSRVADFLKAMRTHFELVTKYWPALFSGLRGASCVEIYENCTRDFLMTK